MKYNTKQHFDLVVIGAGASGMMAALCASIEGKKVCIIEKNKRLGEKLRITGGGRCNITNAEFDTKIFLKNYGEAEQFLHSAFSQFDIKDTFDFFESRGLPIVIEDRKRAFPKTQKATDVSLFFENEIKKKGVVISKDDKVVKINKDGDTIHSVETQKGKIYSANSFIFATGGKSHPETGSTGDGFSWLSDLSLEVSKPTPTIVPLTVSNKWIHELAGKTLTDLKITFFAENSKKISCNGSILCTHVGISGPTILNISTEVLDFLHIGLVTAKIDLYPKKDEKELDDFLLKIFDDNKNKLIKNIVNFFLPQGTGVFILKELGIDENLKVHSISKEIRKILVKGIKSLPVNITGHLGFKKAVVADGGISLNEIDTKTMRVRKYKNLYVTGDLLNIRRPSGGFSLQLCWTTGFVAGKHA